VENENEELELEDTEFDAEFEGEGEAGEGENPSDDGGETPDGGDGDGTPDDGEKRDGDGGEKPDGAEGDETPDGDEKPDGEGGETPDGGEGDADDDLEADLARASAEAEGQRLAADEAAGKGKGADGGQKGSPPPFLESLLEKVGHEKIVTTDGDGKEKTITLRDMAKEYPEMLQSAAAMAKAMAAESVAASQEEIRRMQAEVADLRFWDALTNPDDGIPDARRIATSKEFIEWVGKQPKDVQRLTESPNPAHAKLVIRAYKNGVAKAAAAKTDKKAAGLSSVRRVAAKAAVPAGGGGGKGGEADDFDAGFAGD
jgi:hypothetical protein